MRDDCLNGKYVGLSLVDPRLISDRGLAVMKNLGSFRLHGGVLLIDY